MARLLLFALVLIPTLAMVPAHAVEPDEILKDPALETRARDISAGLRCLVCQNQSIDDSAAPVARDLRILIREQLQRHKSDAEVVEFVVARYGEYVLLRPRFTVQTLILWLSPFLILLAGGFFLWRKRRNAPADHIPLNHAEQAELDAILRKKA